MEDLDMLGAEAYGDNMVAAFREAQAAAQGKVGPAPTAATQQASLVQPAAPAAKPEPAPESGLGWKIGCGAAVGLLLVVLIKR